MLNPKTALFFLSFSIRKFVSPALGHVTLQFLMLGAISVGLNTASRPGIVVMLASTNCETTEKQQQIRPETTNRLRRRDDWPS